jgi:hypothetical protein
MSYTETEKQPGDRYEAGHLPRTIQVQDKYIEVAHRVGYRAACEELEKNGWRRTVQDVCPDHYNDGVELSRPFYWSDAYAVMLARRESKQMPLFPRSNRAECPLPAPEIP